MDDTIARKLHVLSRRKIKPSAVVLPSPLDMTAVHNAVADLEIVRLACLKSYYYATVATHFGGPSLS